MQYSRGLVSDLARRYGYLDYMIERYLALWGESETVRFLDACEHPVRPSLRVNTLKTSPGELISLLHERGVRSEKVPWLEEGLWADFNGLSPGATIEHMRGLFYIQGVPSMTVARVLAPREGEIVLDIASAPGGKTTHLAQLMRNTGLLLSIEFDRSRIVRLESNISRCGVTNCVVLRGDAKKISELGLRARYILLDAPCSGEGLLPIDPTRKTSKTMADIRFCATRESEMLDSALRVLEPGGHIVYSTCSVAPEEGEFVIDEALKRHPEVKVQPIGLSFGSPAYTSPYGVPVDSSISLARRFLPHLHGTEGFFICRMLKEAE
ncbi:MAG: RsmB/NOP family class I SAM-dependent RNA methyltransferase [Candidatus Thorarchaeota archaeon]